jgi:hypothetical protein
LVSVTLLIVMYRKILDLRTRSVRRASGFVQTAFWETDKSLRRHGILALTSPRSIIESALLTANDILRIDVDQSLRSR